MCIYMSSENLGHSYTKIGPFIYFLYLKRGIYHIISGAEKGAVWHAHAYYAIYRELSPPPPQFLGLQAYARNRPKFRHPVLKSLLYMNNLYQQWIYGHAISIRLL